MKILEHAHCTVFSQIQDDRYDGQSVGIEIIPTLLTINL